MPACSLTERNVARAAENPFTLVIDVSGRGPGGEITRQSGNPLILFCPTRKKQHNMGGDFPLES